MNRIRNALALAVLAATAASSYAQTQSMSLEEVRALVRKSMPAPVLEQGTGVLIGLLKQAKLDTERPLSKTFNAAAVTKAVFGRVAPDKDPSCGQPLTASGDTDEGLCTSTSGSPNGDGAFTALSYSKNLLLGNITVFKRPARKDITPTSLPAVQLSDGAAFEGAMKFAISTLGMSKLEIPTPPASAPLPVNTLSLGFGADGKQQGQIDLMRVVHIQRAAELPEPITDPTGAFKLTHVMLPGEATFMLDDTGVQGARVEGWVSMPIDPNLDPKQGKATADLIDEIAQDLYAHGGQQIAKLAFSFAFAPSAYPNPDDPNSPQCARCGAFLHPVLRVAVYTLESVNPAKGEIAAPGLVQDYDLADGSVSQPARLLQ